MSESVAEAERRLVSWRSERAPIAAAVRMRIDRTYVGRQIVDAVEQVIADEAAQRAEGKRTEREETRWSEVIAHAYDPARTREVFGAIVDLYLEDIAGGFDRRLYRAVMAMLPRALDLAFRSRFAITARALRRPRRRGCSRNFTRLPARASKILFRAPAWAWRSCANLRKFRAAKWTFRPCPARAAFSASSCR